MHTSFNMNFISTLKCLSLWETSTWKPLAKISTPSVWSILTKKTLWKAQKTVACGTRSGLHAECCNTFHPYCIKHYFVIWAVQGVTLLQMKMAPRFSSPSFLLRTTSLSLSSKLQKHRFSHLLKGSWASQKAWCEWSIGFMHLMWIYSLRAFMN